MSDMTNISFDSLYCLFKGEPGTRKSTAALSFPRPQYWFSWDKKMVALALPMLKWGINPKDIQYDDYSDWNAPLAKLRQLQLNCPFRTLILDSITSMADATNRQTMKIKGDTGDKGGKVAGIPVNSIEDYKAEESAIGELIALTKDIQSFHKVNIVIIAHVIQKEMKSPDGKTHFARLIVTAAKGSSQKLPALSGEVYHFNINQQMDVSKEGQYALLTTHTGDDFARTSLDLPSEIVFGSDPLYDKWIKPAAERMTKLLSQQSQPKPSTTKSTMSV